MQDQQQVNTHSQRQSEAFILPFSALDHASLPLVGGKGANLGELTRAGFAVPPGFCVTTMAYTLVARAAGLDTILAELAHTPDSDSVRLAELATAARTLLLAADVPAAITEAIREAYHTLGDGAPIPVAVRSSATAEDLPSASFAGQQDTYLNIVGIEAVPDAVRRCWASLWTDRAVSYRQSLVLDQSTVQLSVVVQCQIASSVAGVLFTANPLTGKRQQAVIDANPGLGEAVVSGQVNPDHFVVNTLLGEIVERHLGDKRFAIQPSPDGGTEHIEGVGNSETPCLTDEQICKLAKLGAQIEAHYALPQDIEWALDASEQIWITQTRPITTLYPLPANAPGTDDDLRVYFSLSVAQGVYGPFTPMGIQAFRLFSATAATFILGQPPQDPLAGLPVLVDMGQRLFIDVTPIIRNTLGRKLIILVLKGMETRGSVILQNLITDQRLTPSRYSRGHALLRFLQIVIQTKIPLLAARAIWRPAAARQRIARLEAQLRQQSTSFHAATSEEYLTAVEKLLLTDGIRVIRTVFPVAFAGIGAQVLASRLLKRLATPDEVQVLLRGLPYNPTTTMDMALWKLAQQLQKDPLLTSKVRDTPPAQLAAEYHQGILPPVFQQALEEFLQNYGHRGVAEIDLGLPHWSEDPTHILGALANYLQLTNAELAPDVQFKRGQQEAEAMRLELIRRARRKGWLRGKLVSFYLKRIRELSGVREMPKYLLVLLMTQGRKLLWPVGKELAKAGRLTQAKDIFFVTIPEARAGLSGKDLRPLVQERRASYTYEQKRKHVPRFLLSDGTEPTMATPTARTSDDTLQGTPASSGHVTAKARVILDPIGAHLEPGEILVAPSTDPGWTPLFLTASGLIMEMGGAMSHGSVVAREYGIPAVVGVAGATERITTGQHVTINGSTGIITINETPTL
ncbi:phosphoenolpyruvate synthase [Dictyobacter vulcani]|uniref:Phosphoenolpyruvate synthase n=1 Tax=Dictyobacter vulcani TaxID=2607529 RepID=A0A5J4KNQ6_9CHLR|nr:PEP/pyruvate-binding domain-containing protein [Dictyobacter vulcani]GER91368.1 phosphoenolpyruvate synthase [Dictyobacter vulcani]